MPRLTLTKALTLIDGPFHFRRGQPLEVSEAAYHRLTLTGRLLDPDRSFDSIVPASLKKLEAGTLVTVIRSMGLGDVLMVLPVIRALKREYPGLRFRYAVGSAYVPLCQGCDFLEEAVSILSLQGPVPHVIELRGLSERHEKRNTMDRMDIFGLYCGVEVEDYRFPVRVSGEELDAGRAFLPRGKGLAVVVAVRGSTEVRSWPLANVRAFAVQAAARGWRIVLVDGEAQEMPNDAAIANLTGKLSLLEVKAVLAAADFCVAPDTGIVHLSEAVGTRCVAIFSVIPPNLRITHYQHVRALWRDDLPCAPCWHKGCRPMPCLAGVQPAHVLAAIEGWDELPAQSNPLRRAALVPAQAA